ncbi:hypothetical protein B0H17DRAFT_1208547 [Mycena rosella]|uniref:Uncharacterized protein n=1 Tax=Mycena rosella TaxID=1033263 RepID=A0AAD7D105_MYCRO|nr:hypothetical protein B0H17DRAFT_1208547 [Mycena rosella]
MPALPQILAGASVGGHDFSPETVHRFLMCGGIISVALLVCCFLFMSVPKLLGPRLKRVEVEAVKCYIPVPNCVHLRSDVSIPEYPFDHPRRPSSIASLPTARAARPASQIYRYPGNCWNQEHLAGRPSRPRVAPRPSPLRTVVTCSVSGESSANIERKFAKSDVAQVPEAYSNALPPASHLAPVFPSLDCIGPAFKFACIPTVDTRPAPARAAPARPTPRPVTPLFKWGTVTHTLELPLRGNKMARTPFAKATKNTVTTNFVFSKTSVFYTPTAADKENVYAQSVDAIV